MAQGSASAEWDGTEWEVVIRLSPGEAEAVADALSPQDTGGREIRQAAAEARALNADCGVG